MKSGKSCIINCVNGKLDANTTNEQWQEYFAIMKQTIKQGREKRMKSCVAKIMVNGYSIDIFSHYDGETSYTSYCQFINGILRTIRGNSSNAPAHDYCFYVYQIADLLRFEHDKLNVIWRQEDKCFEVWLDD